MKNYISATVSASLASITALSAQTIITLSVLDDSVMVGENDNVATVAPLAPGKVWFTSSHAGSARARNVNDGYKTQWYFRFNLTPLNGASSGLISSVKLRIPQIGRINSITATAPIQVFDPNASWDMLGSQYPTWNMGREVPVGTGTLLNSFGAGSYQSFGTATDTGNVNVEGTFEFDNAELATTVKSWVSNASDNEGFLVTFVGTSLSALAFGEPTLEVTMDADTDMDGMADSYEDANGLDKNNDADAALDNDSVGGADGLTNLEEFLAGTDPQDSDTDNDGLNDGDEVNGSLNPWTAGVLGTAPGDSTNPLAADSDGDGDNDGLEITNGTDPNAQKPNTGPLFPFVDSDGDSYSDIAETAFGSSPTDADSCPNHTPAAQKPNVVIIYADDLGFGDVSAYGNLFGTTSPATTPHLDTLATQGVLFTQAHSSNAVCTPSRYALLTGKYNWREFNGISNEYGYSTAISEIPRATDTTIAEYLKTQGYDTAAFGKWHLGGNWYYRNSNTRVTGNPNAPTSIDWARRVDDHAVDHGFDLFKGLACTINRGPYLYMENDRNQFWDSSLNGGAGAFRDATNADPITWINNLNSSVVGAKANSPSLGDPTYRQVDAGPFMITDVEEYMAARAASSDTTPFFTYVALYSPHEPHALTAPFIGTDSANGFYYADFMREVDHRIGRVIAAIDNNGFHDNTIVIITSDNGPETGAMAESLRHGGDPNGPYRGVKRDLWEGGTRVPFIIRWPGQAAAGMKVSDLIWQGDIFATVAAFLGEELPDNVAPDGESFLNVIRGQQKPAPSRDSMVVSSGSNHLALKTVDGWKLLDSTGGGGNFTTWNSSNNTFSGAVGTNRGSPKQLFHLAIDIGEDINLISTLTNTTAIRNELVSLTGSDLLNNLSQYRTTTTTLLYTRIPDNDADLLPNSFEIAYGLDPNSPKDAMEDADCDEVSNYDEFLAGTDPTDAGDAFKVTSFQNAVNEFTVNWPSVATRSYTVQWSEDLITWYDVSTHTGNGAQLMATLNKSDIDMIDGIAGNLKKMFVRVEVYDPTASP